MTEAEFEVFCQFLSDILQELKALRRKVEEIEKDVKCS